MTRFGARGLAVALAAAAALVGAPARAAQTSGAMGTVETQVDRTGVEPGLGVEQRPALARAQKLVVAGEIAEAEKALADVIAAIERAVGGDARIRVCVASAAEFKQFAAEHGGPSKVMWVDWAYREAIQTQAYIASGREDFDRALALLERVGTLSPYDPGSFVERGYILNKLGRPKEALDNYRRAYELSTRFPSGRSSGPSALRGMGFSYVELGDLKSGRKAYEDSLALEPNDPTAVQELEYIRSLESKER